MERSRPGMGDVQKRGKARERGLNKGTQNYRAGLVQKVWHSGGQHASATHPRIGTAVRRLLQLPPQEVSTKVSQVKAWQNCGGWGG